MSKAWKRKKNGAQPSARASVKWNGEALLTTAERARALETYRIPLTLVQDDDVWRRSLSTVRVQVGSARVMRVNDVSHMYKRQDDAGFREMH
jgi:hypothetical protein